MEMWYIPFDPNMFISTVVMTIVAIIMWKFFKTFLKIIVFTFVGCVILVCFLNWRDILVWVKHRLPDENPLTELQKTYDVSVRKKE